MFPVTLSGRRQVMERLVLRKILQHVRRLSFQPCQRGSDSIWNLKLISSRVINHLSDTHLSTQTILTILKYYLQFCRNIRPGASHLVPWLMNLQLFILKLCLNSVHEASLDGMIPSLSVQRMRKFLQVCEMQEELNRTQLSAIWLWWSNLQPV